MMDVKIDTVKALAQVVVNLLMMAPVVIPVAFGFYWRGRRKEAERWLHVVQEHILILKNRAENTQTAQDTLADFLHLIWLDSSGK